MDSKKYRISHLTLREGGEGRWRDETQKYVQFLHTQARIYVSPSGMFSFECRLFSPYYFTYLCVDTKKGKRDTGRTGGQSEKSVIQLVRREEMVLVEGKRGMIGPNLFERLSMMARCRFSE